MLQRPLNFTSVEQISEAFSELRSPIPEPLGSRLSHPAERRFPGRAALADVRSVAIFLYTLGAKLMNSGLAYSEHWCALKALPPLDYLTTMSDPSSDAEADRSARLLQLQDSFPEVVTPNGGSRIASVNYLRAALPIFVALDHCDRTFINQLQMRLYNRRTCLTISDGIGLPNGARIPEHGALMLILLYDNLRRLKLFTGTEAREFDDIMNSGRRDTLEGEFQGATNWHSILGMLDSLRPPVVAVAARGGVAVPFVAHAIAPSPPGDLFSLRR